MNDDDLICLASFESIALAILEYFNALGFASASIVIFGTLLGVLIARRIKGNE